MSKKEKGQSLVEFALVLPFLIMLLMGMVEVGFAYYDYMILANANREGVRLASRGRFADHTVFERVVVAGGLRQVSGGGFEPILRASGPDRNLGIIITHIPIEADGSLGDLPTPVYTGTIVAQGEDGPVIRNITEIDTRLTYTDVAKYYEENAPLTGRINDIRDDAGYERQRNEIVIVETFLTHPLIFNFDVLPIKSPVPLYFRSVMRVMRDSSLD